MTSAAIAGAGLFGDRNFARPMRRPNPAMIDQPNPGAAPNVATLTGLGAGSGAGIGIGDSASGLVRCIVGLAPAGTGTLVLSFPAALPAAAGGIFAAADWCSILVSGANPYTLTWTATRALTAGETVLVQYQWVNAT
jgi:hypothetical protein